MLCHASIASQIFVIDLRKYRFIPTWLTFFRPYLFSNDHNFISKLLSIMFGSKNSFTKASEADFHKVSSKFILQDSFL